MNYRKLDDLRFMLFSYGLLMLGILFLLESIFGGLEKYAEVSYYTSLGYQVNVLALLLPVTLLVLKFFSGLVFLYIALEELKITRIEEAILRRRKRRK